LANNEKYESRQYLNPYTPISSFYQHYCSLHNIRNKWRCAHFGRENTMRNFSGKIRENGQTERRGHY